MTINREPCLTLLLADETKKEFLIDFADEPEDYAVDWHLMRQNDLLTTVHVQNLHTLTSDRKKRLFQLALAIRAHPGITQITLVDCTIVDIEALCFAVVKKEKKSTFRFVRCKLELPAAETLCHMLEMNLVNSLTSEKCKFDEIANEKIAEGLRKNKSLSLLAWIRYEPCESLPIMTSVHEMIRSSPTIVELQLTLPSSAYWDLFRAVEILQKLSKLTIDYSHINLQAMEALITMCFVVKPLKQLHLTRCTIDKDALEYLVRTLSNNQIVDDLSLALVIDKSSALPFPLSCGNMKVKELDLTCLDFEEGTLFQTLDDITNNHSVECLDLWGLLMNADAFEKVCNDLVRANKGPSQLVMNKASPHADMVTEAFQHNTSVETLTIADLGTEGLVTFARGLANMRGLRKLTIGYQGFTEQYTKEFFQQLEESLETNTTLETLVLGGIDSNDQMVKQHLPRIHYLLATNRVGRHSMMDAVVPLGIWAHILARSSDEVNGMFFALTGKPEVVVGKSREIMSPSRKRKERDE